MVVHAGKHGCALLPRLPDSLGGLRAVRNCFRNKVCKVFVLGHELVDGENFRVLLTKLRSGLFIERAERVHGLPLCAFKAQLFLLRGDCLPDGGLLRAEKDDFSGGKALGNGKP